MPVKLPSASTASSPSSSPTPAPASSPKPPTTRTTAREDEGDGLTPNAPGEGEGDYGARRNWPEDFSDLAPGPHEFLAYVSDVLRWPWGPVVTFKAFGGDEAGRQIDWKQLPGDKITPAALPYFKARLGKAYTAAGRPWDSWPIVQRGGADLVGADGQPVRVPPYDEFFLREIGGLHVCVMCRVTVDVRRGAEQFPDVTSVSILEQEVGGSMLPVQAPMVRRVMPRIAAMYGWSGTEETLATKVGTVQMFKVGKDNVPVGHAGLPTYKGLGR